MSDNKIRFLKKNDKPEQSGSEQPLSETFEIYSDFSDKQIYERVLDAIIDAAIKGESNIKYINKDKAAEWESDGIY